MRIALLSVFYMRLLASATLELFDQVYHKEAQIFIHYSHDIHLRYPKLVNPQRIY